VLKKFALAKVMHRAGTRRTQHHRVGVTVVVGDEEHRTRTRNVVTPRNPDVQKQGKKEPQDSIANPVEDHTRNLAVCSSGTVTRGSI
jgi:hypothetical protein